MTIRRIIEGKPQWAIDQDLREAELKKKHPRVFDEICKDFYYCRNQNPYNDPKACLYEALKHRIISRRVRRDFERVFVENFEKGLK